MKYKESLRRASSLSSFPLLYFLLTHSCRNKFSFSVSTEKLNCHFPATHRITKWQISFRRIQPLLTEFFHCTGLSIILEVCIEIILFPILKNISNHFMIWLLYIQHRGLFGSWKYFVQLTGHRPLDYCMSSSFEEIVERYWHWGSWVLVKGTRSLGSCHFTV